MSFRENIERYCHEMDHECSNCILESCCVPVSTDMLPYEMTEGQINAVEFRAKILARDLKRLLEQ